MPQYLTFKYIIADQKGAPIYKLFSQWLDSARKLDETYHGPDFSWIFLQLGDFDMIDLTIIKCELWSTWRLKGEFDDLNKGAFIGASAGIFFYHPNIKEETKLFKQQLTLFLQKRRSSQSPIIVLPIKDNKDEDLPDVQEEMLEEYGAHIIPINSRELKGDIRPLMKRIFKKLLEIQQPDRCDMLEIDENFWIISIPELQAILYSDREGISLTPRNPKRREAYLAALAAKIEKEKERLKEEKEEGEKEEDKLKEESKLKERKEIQEEISTEEQGRVAIGPEGDIIPITDETTQEEILELVKKGYKVPEWVVIPRHCPKCFNQDQRAIREVIDKNVVLMENPKIYGFKYVCSKCGNEWR